jgi:hypothetical protein
MDESERLPPASERATFTVTLRAEPHTDAIRGLRWILKHSLRRFGLRCVAVREAERGEPEVPAA